MNYLSGLIRSTVRDLIQNRMYTFAVVAIAGITLAVIVTVSALNVLLLFKPLPYIDSERLVDVHADVAMAEQSATGNSVGFALAWREQLSHAGEFAIAEASSARIRVNGVDIRRGVSYVQPGFFRLFGHPAYGSGFDDATILEEAERAVVICHELALQLGDDPAAAIGQQLEVNGKFHRIVGVTASDFTSPQMLSGAQDSIWLPLAYSDEQAGAWRGFSSSRHLYGRLRPGASVASLQAGLEQLTQRLLAVDAAPFLAPGYRVVPRILQLRQAVVGDGYRAGLMLLAAATLLAALSISIVLTLLVARWTRHRAELALHAVLGARTADIRWMVAAEIVSLITFAFALAVPVTWLCMAALRALAADQLPRLAELRMDPATLFWALVCAAAMAGVIACIASWRMRDPRIIDAMRSSGKGGLAVGSGLQRQVLLTLQLGALAATLYLGAMMLWDSGHRVLMSPGYNQEGSQFLQVEVPEGLRSVADKDAIAADLAAAITSMRPAMATALVDMPPVSRGLALSDVSRVDGSPLGQMIINGVGGAYLEGIGMHLQTGRFFQSSDFHPDTDVIILGETSARLLAGASEPIGMRIRVDGKTLTIVGVVNDVLNPAAQMDAARLQAYVPFQNYDGVPSLAMFLFGNEPISASAMTASLDRIRPGLALDTLLSTASLRTELVQEFYVKAAISVALILLAAIMALAGVHAVISYLFEQMRAELALRIALGARRSDLMKTITGVVWLPLVLALALLLILGIALLGLPQEYFNLTRVQSAAQLLVAATMLSAFVMAAACITGKRLIDRGYQVLLTELQ